MPTTEPPTQPIDPNEPAHAAVQPAAESASPEDATPGAGHSTSRWLDYDTHELLQMISELEDERRWARLREGIWLAILVHIILISGLTWIPKYVLREPQVIDPFEAINKRKDLSYLDVPPDALKQLQPKVQVKPIPKEHTQIDKKTLDEMKKETPPAPEPPKPAETQPAPQQQAQAPVPPTPTSQSAVEAPRPQAVPARPSFAMGSQNPSDQLKQAMRGAASGSGASSGTVGGSGLARHPGAGGGVQILSDTQGVDFNSWLHRWYVETEHTWDPLIPDEVNAPILKKGAVQIRFKVLPNGRIQEGSMVLEGRSGDTGLDRAAWGALTGSNYPPLPRDFHGPYLELRALFLYNMEPPK
ncbi:MAG: hypothetical protein P4L40_11475 [Terracidiphilus sp.]|nr:hypothetical protein [Terracidiphilus sp.]